MRQSFIRKFIDSPEHAVDDMLQGFSLAHPDLIELHDGRIVGRKRKKSEGHVGLVIGNGSGHEPANIGFVGHGLLDVNVCGDFFAAPSGYQLAEGIRRADLNAGVVLFVANHSGDILNARIAMQQVEQEGIEVCQVLLTDDISTAPAGERQMRRGRGGALFAFKIAGALAEQSAAPLHDVTLMAESVVQHTRTLGVTSRPYSDLESGMPVYDIPQSKVEVGTGSHGEGGGELITFDSVAELAELITDKLLRDAADEDGNEVIVLINGTGSTSLMELYGINKVVSQRLRGVGVIAASTVVGNYVTTQDMAGFFISLCWVDQEMMDFWLSPCNAPHFRNHVF